MTDATHFGSIEKYMDTLICEETIHAQSFFVPPGMDNLKRAEEIRRARFGFDARIATLPDIIDARLASSFDSPAWHLPYITTATAIYVGHVKSGLPLLVIAHGIGPMATLDAAYEFSRTSADIAFERKKMFAKLVRGEYGEVSILKLCDVLDALDSMSGIFTYRDALEHLFVTPLLGPRTEEYLRILAQSDMRRIHPLEECHVMFSRFGFERYDLFRDSGDDPIGFFVHADIVGRHSCEEPCTSYCSKFSVCHPDTATRFVAVRGLGSLTGISTGEGEIRA